MSVVVHDVLSLVWCFVLCIFPFISHNLVSSSEWSIHWESMTNWIWSKKKRSEKDFSRFSSFIHSLSVSLNSAWDTPISNLSVDVFSLLSLDMKGNCTYVLVGARSSFHHLWKNNANVATKSSVLHLGVLIKLSSCLCNDSFIPVLAFGGIFSKLPFITWALKLSRAFNTSSERNRLLSCRISIQAASNSFNLSRIISFAGVPFNLFFLP